MLKENESGLFLALCRAFLEVVYPHCAFCFGRCYPGSAAIIIDAKNLYDGISDLLSVCTSRELPKPPDYADRKSVLENGETAVEYADTNASEAEGPSTFEEQERRTQETDEEQRDPRNTKKKKSPCQMRLSSCLFPS